MPALEFVGQSVLDEDNKTANSGRLINVYRQASESGGTLQTVLGSELIETLASNLPTAMATANERLFFTSGNFLYELSESNVLTQRAEIPFDPNTTISTNNEYVCVISRGIMYSWDSNLNTLKILENAAFDSVASSTFLGQRTFTSELNGRRFQWSELIDPTNVNGLSFATAESKDDGIVRIDAVNGLLWVFGTRSIERWYLTGDVDVIAPVAGGTIEKGIKEFASFVSVPQGGAFIATDGRAYMIDGQSVVVISTPAVESTITNQILRSAVTYTQDGNQFLCWIFEDRPAWCYNVTTGEWNERSSDDLGEWKVQLIETCYGKQYALDKESHLLELVDNFKDFDRPLIRSATSRTLSNDGRPFIIKSMELLSVPGSIQDLSRQAAITLEVSKNRGITWNQPSVRTLGASGAYDQRITWRALGRFPAFATARLTWSDPVNIPLEAVVWVELV